MAAGRVILADEGKIAPRLGCSVYAGRERGRQEMRLSVILVNWQATAQTLDCAQMLQSWKQLNPKVLIVDNGSTEHSRRELAEANLADKLIFSSANRGYGGGNNLGIAATERSADAILLLNTDVEITEATVLRLLSRLDDDADLSIIGPTICEASNGSTRHYAGGRDIARFLNTRVEVERLRTEKSTCRPLSVDYVPGMVFLVRRAVFEQIGLLDEEYFFSGEIADFCQRARSSGNKICVDLTVEAFHDTGKSHASLRDTLYVYYNFRNRFRFAAKHHALQKGKYFWMWTRLALIAVGAAVRRRKIRRARAIVWALTDGLIGRYGNRNKKFLDDESVQPNRSDPPVTWSNSTL